MLRSLTVAAALLLCPMLGCDSQSSPSTPGSDDRDAGTSADGGIPGPDGGTPTGWWRPTPEKPIHWHWQLSQNFAYPRDVLANKTVYDLDGELTSADTVAKLHALGPDVVVICYFDAGVYENYRSDKDRFP